QMTAVARTTPGSTIVIDGQTLPMFQGGGIALYSGNTSATPATDLWNQTLARVWTGKEVWSGSVTMGSGYTHSYAGGGWIGLTAGSTGSITLTNSSFNAVAGVILLDPPTAMTLN